MSFFNPEIVPVKLYSWDDDGAPSLDTSAGCVSTIFKACLVTGYGSKEPAGWTMPYEDMDAGVKVFRAAQTVDTDYYLRVSADTGRQMWTEVYTDMTDINTGDLKLKCDTEFKYGALSVTGKWVLIASNRGFWFFVEGSGTTAPANKGGTYIYCGDTVKNTAGRKGIYLKHTGGTWNSSAGRHYIYSDNTGASTKGKLYDPASNSTYTPNPSCFFDGVQNRTNNIVTSQAVLFANNDVYPLPLFSPSAAVKNNRDILSILNNRFIFHGTGAYTYIDSQCVPIDNWVM